MTTANRRPLALIILDGWGVSDKSDGNAVALANTPYYDEICAGIPGRNSRRPAKASGSPTALPEAEAGHLNIGAGRIVQTDIARIARSIRTGDFAEQRAAARDGICRGRREAGAI